MHNYKKYTINKNEELLTALRNLNSLTHKVLIVVNENDVLCGTISDGDLRRWFIKSSKEGVTCMDIMNPNCIHAKKGNLNEIVKQAHMKGVSLIPIVNDSNKVIDAHEVPIKLKEKKLNTVVIMAGGKGTRLLPITQNIPKPMIKVGGKPILARIIEKLIQEGFENIIISLGYLSEVIEDFINKNNYQANINFVYEDKPLGTAGALSSIDKKNTNFPILVTNGDILCEIDYQKLFDRAEKECYEGIMLSKNEEIFIPFGVINEKEGKWLGLEEKPSYSYLVNAGIYLVSESMIKLIKKNEYLDMPQLFERASKKNIPIGVEITNDFWIDIGRHETLKLADKYFNNYRF